MLDIAIQIWSLSQSLLAGLPGTLGMAAQFDAASIDTPSVAYMQASPGSHLPSPTDSRCPRSGPPIDPSSVRSRKLFCLAESAVEAIRDLVRACEDAVNDQRRVRQRPKSLLLRHGHAFTGTRWGPKRELNLSKIRFENAAQHIVFTEYRVAAARFATELVDRLTKSLRAQAEMWRWLSTVKGLMTLRSIDFISALVIVAELGDLRRLPHPRKLMGYLGLVPVRTFQRDVKATRQADKDGKYNLRRTLVEAAWNYWLPARIGESL
ncbi:transposase [Paraburkholderia sp. XV]|uniref:transposase n=1 Tax=Paraburkholderia sp. XV TaxID=2831520 RepID=UPI001CD2EF52|nr:transposase [Paraburkholderia sp. XV]